MTPNNVFLLIISILIVHFLIGTLLDYLNAKNYQAPIPKGLEDVYPAEDYQKSLAYKKTNYSFEIFSNTFSLIITLGFFLANGFQWLHNYTISITTHPIFSGLLFLGILMIGNDILSLPFYYYKNFVIEERFGFNKMTISTFILDKIKGWLMLIVIGGVLFASIIWCFEQFGQNFWWYAWGILSVFSIFLNMFYAKLIVPLFNKQSPLEQGSLRNQIESYGTKVGFDLKNIFVIDGSKRSTKANAYFSGFGSEKRVTLFDTLINELSEDEIVAVFAHEVGHYKRKHIIFNLVFSLLSTGFTLWLFSVFVFNPLLSQALGVAEANFYIGLVSFGILYTPISEVVALIMNFISRKFEYQADDYAKQTFAAEPLVSALKKLSKSSLSNLTPHPWYEFYHYSHPSLQKRITNLLK